MQTKRTSLRKRGSKDTKEAIFTTEEQSPKLEKVQNSEKIKTLFKDKKVNTGHSIAELSEHHRVIIFTIKWFGCPLCQDLLERLADMFTQMLLTNTIPVIGHQQSQKSVDYFFNNTKNQILKNFLYTKIEKEDREILGLKDSPLSQHMKTVGGNLKALLYEDKYFQFPSDVIAPLTSFGVFSIENSKITKKVIYEDFTKRLNFGLFLQDMGFSKLIDSEDDYVQRITSLYKDLDLRLLRRVSKEVLSKNERMEKGKSTELKVILEDDTKRFYFKAFATNEFSLETLMFYEEICQFKKCTDKQKRFAIVERIYNYYLNEGGIYQVNTTTTLTKPIKEKIDSQKDENLINEMFDEVLDDVIANQMADTYNRFKKSKLFDEMQSEKNVVSYLI